MSYNPEKWQGCLMRWQVGQGIYPSSPTPPPPQHTPKRSFSRGMEETSHTLWDVGRLRLQWKGSTGFLGLTAGNSLLPKHLIMFGRSPRPSGEAWWRLQEDKGWSVARLCLPLEATLEFVNMCDMLLPVTSQGWCVKSQASYPTPNLKTTTTIIIAGFCKKMSEVRIRKKN